MYYYILPLTRTDSKVPLSHTYGTGRHVVCCGIDWLLTNLRFFSHKMAAVTKGKCQVRFTMLKKKKPKVEK